MFSECEEYVSSKEDKAHEHKEHENKEQPLQLLFPCFFVVTAVGAPTSAHII
jgi:hypothetical protein